MQSITNFQKNFRFWRLRKGIGQQTAACRSGISCDRISAFERGKDNMKASERRALAKAINEDYDRLHKVTPPDIPLFLTPEAGYKIRLYLEKLRKQKNWSVHAFCKKAGIYTNDWRWGLRTKHGICVSRWLHVCDVLGLDPRETLRG